MNDRRRMMNGAILVAALAAVGIAACQQAPVDAAPAPVPVAAATHAPQAFPRPARALGIDFDYDTTFQLRPCEETPRCMILSDPAAEDFVRDLLTVQVHAGALEAVAAEEGGFVRDAEGRLMTTYGRFEPVAVEAFEVNGKPGLRAVVICGISEPENGFHAAAGNCLWAVVSDGTQSVVISSSGFGNGLDAAEEAVRSVRFTAD